jgi:hypothetical protein
MEAVETCEKMSRRAFCQELMQTEAGGTYELRFRDVTNPYDKLLLVLA